VKCFHRLNKRFLLQADHLDFSRVEHQSNLHSPEEVLTELFDQWKEQQNPFLQPQVTHLSMAYLKSGINYVVGVLFFR